MEMTSSSVMIHEQTLVHMVNQYQGMLLRMCYVYLRDEDQAQDAVQETFLKAYRALPAFRGDCSEKTWLIRIAMNICRSMQRSAWFRHHDRRVTPEELPIAASMAEAEGSELMGAIMELAPKWKEIIMLYYWQNMNVKEIADALGIAQSTVSNRLRHARELLHDMLEGRLSHE